MNLKLDMSAYQHAARKTLQDAEGADPLTVTLLGLASEAGSVLTTYKKQLRDGSANPTFKAQLREELGDTLYYLAVSADLVGLDLGDVAAANLHKVADRWRPTAANQIPFDDGYPPQEQLPRKARFHLELRPVDGITKSVLTWEGGPVGDPLTNASHIDDDYRMHDVFHLAHVAVLGWSPVMRSMLKRKRRSNPRVDEAEDGGRAIVAEEGVSLLVFSYASQHNYLDGKTHVDNYVLQAIADLVSQLEVSAHRAADWEKAILTGYAAWRQLHQAGGGTIDLDMETQSLTIS